MEAGGKLRVYLDTSVVNHLFAYDTPDRKQDTTRLWEECRAGKFEVFASPVVLYEIGRCEEPKRSWLLEKMRLIEFLTLEETKEANDLAADYIRNGVFKERDFDDCLHVAYAVVSGCDLVISWNFKHLVNDKTRGKVKVVNATNRYKEIGIVSPTEFLMGVWK